MRRSITAVFAFGAIFTSLLVATPAQAGLNGIEALVAVIENRADDANDEALGAADKQRDLVRGQQRLRQERREAPSNQQRIFRDAELPAAAPRDVQCRHCVAQAPAQTQDDDD